MVDLREATIVTYLGAMARGDLESVCACFTAKAIIMSPVYGDVPVRQFYQKLFEDTVSAEIFVQQIYCGRDREDRWAAHFYYRWKRKSGNDVDTDLVDLFEFEGDRIAKLRIIFDSSPKS
jgi:ketosteroid isomerase-like protein